MPNSSDQKKRQAARLAARLIEAQDLRSAKSVLAEEARHNVARENEKEAVPESSAVESSLPKRVAAWVAQDTEEGECFVRSDALDPWSVFAKTERIPPKGAKPRVVLIGESVARGYLYDPHINCASVLQELLDHATGSDGIEVIDLAQNGLQYAQLPEIVESALVLRPDAFVIFAGNNWRIPPGVRLDRLIEILRAHQSWQAVVDYIEETTRQATQALVAKLSELSTKRLIPLLFVIPEFNAADWRSGPGLRSPLLTGAHSRRWRQLLIETERRLASKDYDIAAASARAMIDLDDGASPAPYEMMAISSRKRGDHANARRFIDQAGRIALSLPAPKAPRCFPVIQETLRSECAGRAIEFVDLPARISEFSSGALPDRNLFLDYCHLNLDGIRLAMACAAERLLSLLGKPTRPWRELNTRQFSIDRRVLAQAHFSAAVMNARGGQGYEIVRFHFTKAIQYAPEIVDLGFLFADFNLRRTPFMMCRTFEDLLSKRDSFPSISLLAVDTPDQENRFNMVLIRALKDALSAQGSETVGWIDQILQEEHAAQAGGTNLLSKSSCDLTSARLEYEWWEGAAYFKAREPESRFHLICESPLPVELKLTCRLHSLPLDGEPVSVIVNGCVVGEFMASTSWSQRAFVVPPEILRRGLNSVILSWPEPQQSAEERIEEMGKYLETIDPINMWYSLPEIYPIYGEVHDFYAALQPARLEVEADEYLAVTT